MLSTAPIANKPVPVTIPAPAPPGAGRSVPPPSLRTTDWRVLADLMTEISQSSGVGMALDMAHAAAEADPADGNVRFLLGQALAAAGRRKDALASLSQALRLGTEIEVLDQVARIAFPGPRYRENLAWLHRLLRPATYLEIGVFEGDTLCLAEAGGRAIGIDPAPLPAASRAYRADTVLHRLTSDAYFAAVAAGDLPSPAPVSLAFIDGLHLFDQVLRDFINTERLADPRGVIVLHDTLPVAPAAATRPRTTSYWCGDVWKMVPCLRRYRPDLRLLTIPAYPSGLTLVANLDPASTVLDAAYDQAIGGGDAAAAAPATLDPAGSGDIPNDPAQVLDWLRSTPAGAHLPPA